MTSSQQQPAEERVNRSHLTESRPLRWDCEASSPRAAAALDALLADLEAQETTRKRRRRSGDRGRLRVILEAITLEAWSARRETPQTWLAYSRGEETYLDPDRYRHPHATLTTVRTVVGFLAAAGLVEDKLGSYHRTDHGFGQSGKGYLSRLRGTDRLLAWIDGQGLTHDDVALNDRFELIRLKGPAQNQGGRKPLLSYQDTSDTIAMRERLRAWTAMMSDHPVTFGPRRNDDGRRYSSDLLEDPLGDTEETQTGGEGSCRLYRIFNDGRWDRGGRFYGGWWQGLSKADRNRLLIDGEETVELDFASLHPRLCYQLNGSPLAAEDDPYAVPNVPDDLRDLVKVAMMQLLNAHPGKVRLATPKGGTSRLARRLSYEALTARLEARHGGISNWFRQGLRGLELQAIDAAIADMVMNYFTVTGRPILPVHDSFIVVRRDELKLAETMALAYQGQLSLRVHRPAAPSIKGWSAEEVGTTFKTLPSLAA